MSERLLQGVGCNALELKANKRLGEVVEFVESDRVLELLDKNSLLDARRGCIGQMLQLRLGWEPAGSRPPY
jgi:hypothetical protein